MHKKCQAYFLNLVGLHYPPHFHFGYSIRVPTVPGKPWKNDESFSSHGNIMEFLNCEKCHGKIGKTPGKMRTWVTIIALFLNMTTLISCGLRRFHSLDINQCIDSWEFSVISAPPAVVVRESQKYAKATFKKSNCTWKFLFFFQIAALWNSSKMKCNATNKKNWPHLIARQGKMLT